MAKMQDTSRDKLESRNAPGFLSRWSQRKQDQQDATADTAVNPTEDRQSNLDTVISTSVRDAPVAADASLVLDSEVGVVSNPEMAPVETTVPVSKSDVDALEGEEEEVLLSDEDMPPLEDLQKDSDVSMFFNRGVSRELRKAALRKLFSLPALNITDGLNDYDEDYTTFEPLGDIVTSDMRFHAERKARLAEEAEAEKRAALEAEDSDEAAAEAKDDDGETDAEDSIAEDSIEVENETATQAIADDSDGIESERGDPELPASKSPDGHAIKSDSMEMAQAKPELEGENPAIESNDGQRT